MDYDQTEMATKGSPVCRAPASLSKQSFVRRIAAQSALVALVLSLGTASAAETEAQTQPQAINKITSAAVQLGVLTCAARVQQVTSFLGVTETTNATLRRPIEPADQNSFALAMSVETDGTTAVASAEFYPSPLGCKATYSITVPLQESCEAVRQTSFAELGNGVALSETITALTGANTMRIMLIDAGEGCTLIKTETLD